MLRPDSDTIMKLAKKYSVIPISRFGSVEVTEYQMIHKYSRIMHICSQVEGDIRVVRNDMVTVKEIERMKRGKKRNHARYTSGHGGFSGGRDHVGAA